MKNSVWLVVLLAIFVITGCARECESTGLKGPYFGQTPPGMTPQVFLPGVLNTEEMGAFCTVFTPSGDSFYFVHYRRAVEDSGSLSAMRRVNDIWTAPEPLPFGIDGLDNDMCLSKDGNRMIFRSWRALPDGSSPDGHSWLWYADRTPDGWSEAQPFLCGGEVVRTGYPSIADSGAVYFAHRRDGVLGIYRSQFVGGVYAAPEFVYTLISNEFILGDMFVARDESYMIISGKDPEGAIGYGGLDLYITFRQSGGSWSEAANMGPEINTAAGENCPQLSPDGRYFFFNRYDPEADWGNMYWVDAAIVK